MKLIAIICFMIGYAFFFALGCCFLALYFEHVVKQLEEKSRKKGEKIMEGDEDIEEDVEEEYEACQEYRELLEMVQEKHPEVKELNRIGRQVIVDYHDRVDNKIRPLCRVAVCEDYPGVVSYFFVAVQYKGGWFYYVSQDW